MEKNIFIIEPLWNSSQLVQEVGSAIRSDEYSNISLSSEESRNVNYALLLNNYLINHKNKMWLSPKLKN